MALPALTGALKSAFKAVRDGFASTPDLGLKAGPVGGVSFDAVNAGWYARNGYPGLYSILSGGMPAWSGEVVSIPAALNHSVVWACNRLISETTSFLPVVMLQERRGSKEVVVDHPIANALRYAPNDEMSAMTFRESRTSHTVLGGNGYAQIIRRSGTGVALQLRPLDPSQVTPDREKQGEKRLVYVVKEGNSAEKTFTVETNKPQDILHLRGHGWDGMRGYSVITMARQSLGTAIAGERNVARFFANGGRVPYILEMATHFKSEADFNKFRADWEAIYSEPHRAPILEDGTKYKQIGLNFADAQLLESRQFSIPEICRWFAVSPHLVGDLSRATFSNIEQLALQFEKLTLSGWLNRWEEELWRCVLTPEEKSKGYFFRHNLRALLRADFATRMAGYATMLQNGVASVNEIRDLEDWNPIDGGDDHHIQLNMQSLPGGTPLTSQATQLIRLGGGKPGASDEEDDEGGEQQSKGRREREILIRP